MTNPFDDSSAIFLVLVNEEGQYSLWPATIDVPAGWKVTFGEESREACLEYINSNWQSLMPLQEQ